MISILSNADAAAKALGELQRKVRGAIARGLNEGGDLTRTRVRRAMREQTSLLRLSSITKRSSTIRAYDEKLSYSIVYRGKPPTRPDEFRTTVRAGPGGGVTIRMWGVDHKLERSFQRRYEGGLRARLGAARLPIQKLNGPNLAKEAAKRDGDVAKTFVVAASLFVPPAIAKYLAKFV